MATTIDSADVVVVGGGVSGLSSAWWLAQNDVDVILIEKEIVGWEASGRNGGLFGHRGVSPVGDLGRVEEELWPSMDDRLGYPTETCPGSIRIALTDEDWDEMLDSARQAEALGVDYEIMDNAAVREAMPIVAPDVRGGILRQAAGHANPQRTCQAYAWALLDLGGRIYQHTTVTGFTVESNKVTTVHSDQGDFGAGFVVCAAGPQTGVLAESVGAFVPVAPGRPEIIVTAPLERMWRGGFSGNGLYGRQTERGNLAYGGGWHEWIDVDLGTPEKPNTPLVRNVSRRVGEMFPGAADVPVIRSWACVVEQTPDYYPIIDVLSSPENFLVCTMSGDGFGLSPATGMAVADLVKHGETPINIEGLRLSRFADVPVDWREQRNWVPGADTSTREYAL